MEEYRFPESLDELPTLLTFCKRKKHASVLLSHSGNWPYLWLQQSLAHPNTQHGFCPSPKQCCSSCPMISFRIFTLFLDTPMNPHILTPPMCWKYTQPNVVSAFEIQMPTRNNLVGSIGVSIRKLLSTYLKVYWLSSPGHSSILSW